MDDGLSNTLPDISVVVPVYNDPNGLQSLIPALLDQSLHYERYEILVVDNNSTDETSLVLNRFAAEHPALIRPLEENQIQSSYAARNRGIENARGKIIAFTDADCRPYEDWLEQGLEAFGADTLSLAAGRVKISFQQQEPNLWEYISASTHLNQRHYVEQGGYGATANLFVLRQLFHQYGDFNEQLRSGGDNEFGRRVTGHGEKITYLENAVVEHRARSDFVSLWTKQARVGRGVGRLHEMGVLDWNPRHPRCFLPRLHFPHPNAGSLSLMKHCVALILYNIFRYINVLNRF